MEQFVTLESMSLEFQPDRNLAMELVRATEAAAIRSFPFIGRSGTVRKVFAEYQASRWLDRS
ncbi:MAG: hypothetical protein EBW45_00155 [Actinobacteria bacterium]|nr:hypothetical protein [Actinomycetota bacterium]NCW41307.1 hypothetical protein [Actinomycetota bacterium]